MPEPAWIITASARQGDIPFERSVIRWCSICGTDVWLSPEAVEKLNNEINIKIACLECAIPMMAQHDRVHTNQLDPTNPEAPMMNRWIRKLVERERKKLRDEG